MRGLERGITLRFNVSKVCCPGGRRTMGRAGLKPLTEEVRGLARDHPPRAARTTL